MRRRAELTEWMDNPAAPRQTLARSLAFIRRVNRWLGGTRAVMGHLRKWSQRWPKHASEEITFLDVATGSADIPLAALAWARRRGFRLRFIGLDIHPTTLALAREHVTKAWPFDTPPPLTLLPGDALALPFADRSIDYVTCSMFLHHLRDQQAATALCEMLRVARRGVIVNDLLRSRRALLGIYLLTLLAAPMEKHDARVSVEKAWTRGEVQRLKIAAAGGDWLVYHEHIPARFTLAGERLDLTSDR